MKGNGMDGKNGKNGNEGEHSSHPSHDSHSSHPVLPPRGDYRTLLSFQKAEVVYDLTFRFCHKFLARGDRTVDQMVQAARPARRTSWKAAKPG